MSDKQADEGMYWDKIGRHIPPSTSSQLLGMTPLDFDPETSTVTVQYEGRSEFTNPLGNIQGGYLSAMADNAITLALTASNVSLPFVTLEQKISFLQPTKVGPIIVEGRIVHRGKSIIFLDAGLYQPNDNLVASATTTVKVLSPR